MQEMIELSSQQQKEQQLPPRAVQIISHPFFGRVVLTAGPAQFGMDLSKHQSGVCVVFENILYFVVCVNAKSEVIDMYSEYLKRLLQSVLFRKET